MAEFVTLGASYIAFSPEQVGKCKDACMREYRASPVKLANCEGSCYGIVGTADPHPAKPPAEQTEPPEPEIVKPEIVKTTMIQTSTSTKDKVALGTGIVAGILAVFFGVKLLRG